MFKGQGTVNEIYHRFMSFIVGYITDWILQKRWTFVWNKLKTFLSLSLDHQTYNFKYTDFFLKLFVVSVWISVVMIW